MVASKHAWQSWWGIVFALFGLLLLLVSVPLYVRDTRYVDCRSGRTMREVHVAGLRVSQQTQESAFSRIVAGNVDVNTAAAEWKPYFSRSPFWQTVSPHYRFHSVPHDLDQLVAWLRMQQRNEEEVRARCLEALKFLNAHDVEGLKRYCTSLYDETGGNETRNAPVKPEAAVP